jgi:hypothetical protein
MYLDSDSYPELVYSVTAQQLREQRHEEQLRQARRERRARRATRVRARLPFGGSDR